MTAITDIHNERIRQQQEEGWTEEHDNHHVDGSLAMAGACYAAPKNIFIRQDGTYDEVQFVDPWPWPGNFRGNPVRNFTKDMKDGKERRRQLVIAAALIVAEIERLDRTADRDEKGQKP